MIPKENELYTFKSLKYVEQPLILRLPVLLGVMNHSDRLGTRRP